MEAADKPRLVRSEAEEARIRSVYAQRQHDERYSWFSPGYVFAMQSLEREMLALLNPGRGRPLASLRILEVGCGTGYWLRQFVKWGARPENVAGIDLLSDRVAEARRLCPGEVTVRCGSAARLAFDDQSFDVVFQSLVFTSVRDSAMKRQIAEEMVRVTRKPGFILWYDFFLNNPGNPDVRGVGRREIRELFPRCSINLRRVGLAPPLFRAIAPHSWMLCAALEKIPLLRTHYLGVIAPA
jgi:SAM-dependent methyltransferase